MGAALSVRHTLHNFASPTIHSVREGHGAVPGDTTHVYMCVLPRSA